MIRISYASENVQNALRALDKKTIDEQYKLDCSPPYPFYRLCFCCREVVIGIGVSYGDRDSEGIPTCFDRERICPRCEDQFQRFNVNQPNKNMPLFNKLPPKEKPIFTNGQAKVLGDALIDWLCGAITFYKRSCWFWSHADGWVRKPIYNVSPFRWEHKSIPGPGRPQRTLHLTLFVPGKNPRVHFRVVRFKYGEDLAESFEAFLQQIKKVLKHTTVEHRKQWKRLLENSNLP